MKNVLIVDDNPNVRRALCKFVQNRTDLQVSGEAADGTEAIRKARELRPDMILMDLAMPNLSGAGAAAAIRKFLPRTHIIVFSLYPDLVGKNMARALGVDIVIDKSEGSAALTEALHNVLVIEGNGMLDIFLDDDSRLSSRPGMGRMRGRFGKRYETDERTCHCETRKVHRVGFPKPPGTRGNRHEGEGERRMIAVRAWLCLIDRGFDPSRAKGGAIWGDAADAAFNTGY